MLSKSSIGLASAFALIGALGAADPAWAGSKIFAPLGTTLTMSSTIEQNAVGNLDPFTVEVFGAPGECLRIAQTTGADLFAVLVSPNQTVWRDEAPTAACTRASTPSCSGAAGMFLPSQPSMARRRAPRTSPGR